MAAATSQTRVAVSLELSEEEADALLGHLEDDMEMYNQTKWQAYERSPQITAIVMSLRSERKSRAKRS